MTREDSNNPRNQNKSWDQLQKEAEDRQKAAYEKKLGRRDTMYGIMDQEEAAAQSAYDRLEGQLEEERGDAKSMATRGLSAKVGDTGFGGGGILAGAQAGKEMGEMLGKMRREGAERKYGAQQKVLSTRKENIKTREAEGDRLSDYASVLADGEKELQKAISDTRNPWYEGGDDEEEAERRMRAALAGLMNRNPEAVEFLTAKYLRQGGAGYRQNHA